MKQGQELTGWRSFEAEFFADSRDLRSAAEPFFLAPCIANTDTNPKQWSIGFLFIGTFHSNLNHETRPRMDWLAVI